MKLTEKQKIVKEIASADWNRQCKNFMVANVPFKDQTARKCFDRIYKEIYGNQT